MRERLRSLNDRDISERRGAIFAGPPVKPPADAKPESARRPLRLRSAFRVAAADGIGITPQYPSLAGQYDDYSIRALTDYKKVAARTPSWRASPDNHRGRHRTTRRAPSKQRSVLSSAPRSPFGKRQSPRIRSKSRDRL
jgi:hypothetical protein